jgi:hypothetical protein
MGEIREGAKVMGGGAPDISVSRPDFTPPVGQMYTATRGPLHSFGGDLLLLAGGRAASRRVFRCRSLSGKYSEADPRDAESAWSASTLSGRGKRSARQMWPPSLSSQPAQARHRRRAGNAKRRRSTSLLRQSAAGVKMTDDTGNQAALPRRPRRRSSPDREHFCRSG